ncbi:MAG: hypothetical protein Q8S57_09080 [Methanoregula sp.]|nr:hypothetical protein [Methanoregula sp.]
MKAIICEYLWQMNYIKNEPEALLISISPEMSYELSKCEFSFKECSEICNHQELWENYPNLIYNFFLLTNRLDEILWEIDPRFEELDFPIFDRLSYMLKVTHDQSIYFAHLIRELIDLGVDTIACADNGGPEMDLYGLFVSEKSIIPEIVRSFGSTSPVLEIHTQPPQIKSLSSYLISFGQPVTYKKMFSTDSIYSVLCNLKFALLFRLQKSGTYQTVISVGCKEVDALDATRFHKTNLIKFSPFMEYTGRCNNWPHMKNFLDYVKNDEVVNQQLFYKGANLTNLILRCIGFLSDKLEMVLKEYKKVCNYLDHKKIDFVVFQTMAPLYLPNVIIFKWCRERKIPFSCWMHGGYGAYESLQGYDVTDYRLSHQHFVYGQVLADLPSDPNWIIHKIGYTDRLKKINVMGSPFFERLYSDYKRPDNQRKKILFSIGNYYHHNQFYFGHNRVNSELSIWRIHKRILEELVKFENTYDIIVKDYPNSQQVEMWPEVIRDSGAVNIRYIRNERPFSDTLVEADLHIFSWVSTTFFQSMYTDADICLFDDTDLTSNTKDLFREHLVFSSDLEDFCSNLADYLQKGIFYCQNKKGLREKFVDSGNKGRRPEQFESVLDSLITDG